jgi:glyoxylate reductase
LDTLPKSIKFIAHSAYPLFFPRRSIPSLFLHVPSLFSVLSTQHSSSQLCLFPDGAGYDPIDVLHAKTLSIAVSHTPGSVDNATATTASYLILASLRQFSKAEKNVRAGNWKTGLPPARDPEGMTLGVVGMGGIGGVVAERMEKGWGMKVLYHNRNVRVASSTCGRRSRLVARGTKTHSDNVSFASPSPHTSLIPSIPCPAPLAPLSSLPQKIAEGQKGSQFTYCSSLQEMLGQCDVVSLNLPLNKNTAKSFGAEQFGWMKDGAVLVNTAR